jgi:hypothetical protein
LHGVARRLPVLAILAVLSLAGSACQEHLTWAAPQLDGDVRVIDVPPAGGDWYGTPTTRDCLIRMPAQPVQGLVKVSGCHDVKLVGGEWRSDADPCSAEAAGSGESAALYLTDFSGVAHVEGVKVSGRGFSDGLWITSTAPSSVSQVQGSWFGGFAACTEQGGYATPWPLEHPDCFQTWAGPRTIRFDKNTCRTIYEGFNLDSANWANAMGVRYPAAVIDVRRTNVRLGERTPNGRQCFSVWNPYSPTPTHLDRARCDPGARDFPGAFAPRLDDNPSWWGGVLRATPLQADEIAPDEAGIGYGSPGYR